MISIIIILYNSKKYIKKCLESINDNFEDDDKYEIILFNNNPREKYSNKIVQNNKIINSKKNIGYSKALNHCISISNGEFILTLNPDTILYDDTIESLHKTFNNDVNIGIVGAKVLNKDLTLQLSARRSFPTSFVIFKKYMKKINLSNSNPYNYSHINIDSIQEVDCVSGACMMFRKKLYSKINKFDERFFLYFEDTDFCIRSINANYKVILNPKAKIIHFKRGSRTSKNNFVVSINFYISMVKYVLKYYYMYKTVFFLLLLILIIIFI